MLAIITQPKQIGGSGRGGRIRTRRFRFLPIGVVGSLCAFYPFARREEILNSIQFKSCQLAEQTSVAERQPLLTAMALRAPRCPLIGLVFVGLLTLTGATFTIALPFC